MSSSLARGILASLSRSQHMSTWVKQGSTGVAAAAVAGASGAVRRGAASLPAAAVESDDASEPESSSRSTSSSDHKQEPRWLRELGVVRNDWT